MNPGMWVLLVLYVVVGAGLLAMTWVIRTRTRQGRPAKRDLHPYEVAYLLGGARHAIATALTALRLDGAIDSFADGRIRATGSGRQNTARMPLDGKVYGMIRTPRGAGLAKLTRTSAVQAAIDKLRDGLAERGQVIDLGGRRRLNLAQGVIFVWLVMGLGIFVWDPFTKAFRWNPAGIVAIIAIFVGLLLLSRRDECTREGYLALQRAQERNTHLDPASVPSYSVLDASECLMGVALYGTAALMALDPAFAQTVGLGRYLQLTRISATSGGYAGPACGAVASVCSSGDCSGGGSCGGGSGGGSDGGVGGGCGGGGG